uniref:Uncharacterized protein n=1 Tax=Vitis vinifera TaxID=29760 RepID=A5BMW3_VITVI|nr:hypothetical protein VITISV_006424 [Vitis vinifera]
MAWMQSHGNFSHPEVISYELLEGEVFNSKFCINPLEPISMAIESQSNSEDVFSEDERLGSSSLGVKKAGDTSWTRIKWYHCQGPLRGHESVETPGIGNIRHVMMLQLFKKQLLNMSHAVAVVVVVAAIAVISFGGDEVVVDEAQTLTATVI